MKMIKISNKTKEQLDNLKDEKETYNNIVSRIIRENKELRNDKEFLKSVMRKLTMKH